MSNTQRSNIFQFRSPTNANLVTFSSTGDSLATFHSPRSIIIPTGTSLERDTLITSPQPGMLRFNSTTLSLEFYNGSSWLNVGGSVIDNTFEVPFTQTTGVVPISTVAFTGRILNVSVIINVPFNGTGFSINVGTVITPNLLMPDGEIDATFVGTNYKISNIAVTGQVLQANINAGTGNAGSGIIIVEYAL